jgi:hypothetical protein
MIPLRNVSDKSSQASLLWCQATVDHALHRKLSTTEASKRLELDLE